MTRECVRSRRQFRLFCGSVLLGLGLVACEPLAQTRVVYLERCPRTEVIEQHAQADEAAPAFYAATPPVSSRECREVPYDSSAGPRLFDVEQSEDGWLQFRSDLPFGRGDRLSSVIDANIDVEPERMPLEVVVEGNSVTPTKGVYLVRATFPEGLYAPSRLVGPIESGWQHLVGEAGDGALASYAEIGKPQLQYQVWLEQGVLQQVTLRCSRSAYVTQLWLVTDKRRCIYSELQRI